MANVLITPTVITKEAITQFKNEAVLANMVDRQHDTEFKEVGDLIEVRQPILYKSISDDLDLTGQLQGTGNSAQERSTSLQLAHTESVALQFTQKDLTLTIEEFSERHIKPAMIEIVQQIELKIADLYKYVYNFVGTPGTTPSTLQNVADVKAQLTRSATPRSDRMAVYEATAGGKLAAGIPFTAGTSVPDAESGRALREATVTRYAGMDINESEAIKMHTTGTHSTGSTPLVNDASPAADSYPTGTASSWVHSLVTDGWAASTAVLKEGDVITIAGVNQVNPKTYQDTGQLQNFVVRGDVTSDGTGNATFNISPPIITSGPYQTVTAVYANNAAITVKTGNEGTTHPQNLCFHKTGITLAMAPLLAPDNTISSTETMDGISVTYARDGNITEYNSVRRLDVLYGVLVQVPQYVCRHTG